MKSRKVFGAFVAGVEDTLRSGRTERVWNDYDMDVAYAHGSNVVRAFNFLFRKGEPSSFETCRDAVGADGHDVCCGCAATEELASGPYLVGCTKFTCFRCLREFTTPGVT